MLWQFAPDSLEYGLHYAGVLRAGANYPEALRVLASLRSSEAPGREDPRLDLSESRVHLLSGDYTRASRFARSGAAKAAAIGFRLPVAEARLLEGRSLLHVNDVDGAIRCFGMPRGSMLRKSSQRV